MSTKENQKSINAFASRDLSWLSFNQRVLSAADDKSYPLLERLKFLSIYSSNLDEFFMVRVGSLEHRAAFLPGYKDPKTGWNTETELKKIAKAVVHQEALAERIWDRLRGDFAAVKIDYLNCRRMSKEDELIAKKMFAELRPMLSPRIVDARHPMPFLGNQEEFTILRLEKNGETRLGLVPLYRLPDYRVFENGEGVQKVVPVSRLVLHFASQLFKKYSVREGCSIRITRNADVFFDSLEKSEEGDARFDMQKLLKKRKRQQPVRLQISGKASSELVSMLMQCFQLPERSCFVSSKPFSMGFGSLLGNASEYKFSPRKSVKTVELKKGDYFRYLDKEDMLLSLPFQSMTPFVDLLYEAADDPDVESIKITLYRLAASSKVAAALAYAADKGKDVLCLLELRARFDEQNNIDYSEVLEDAGCSVIYGLEDMKVHSKLCLITRKTRDGLSYYTQIGTGNYNETTSEQYTDLSFITSDRQTGEDAAAVFEALSLGRSPEPTVSLWTAPRSFKQRLLEQLDLEIAKGSEGSVFIKVNSINDMEVMQKLIECSKAGVKVELCVRGICCIIPGIAGCTDNITVKSIIGRYLEHSRIYAFGKGRDMKVFIGSADLLNRNTSRRVEVLADVSGSNIKPQIQEIINALRADMDGAWAMQPDGTYVKLPEGTGTSSQDNLYRYFIQKKIRALPAAQGNGSPGLLDRLRALLKSKKS